MDVIPFRSEFTSDVLALIVGIQQNEFGIEITAEQQQDLHDISGFYQVASGNFWLAVVEGRVVGTIALLDIGNHQGALRKMFVHPDFRGSESRTAMRLLDELLDWAGHHGIQEIFLGTTSKFLAAHRFYEKSGFSEVQKSALPQAFPVMTVDTRFYHRRVEANV